MYILAYYLQIEAGRVHVKVGDEDMVGVGV